MSDYYSLSLEYLVPLHQGISAFTAGTSRCARCNLPAAHLHVTHAHYGSIGPAFGPHDLN